MVISSYLSKITLNVNGLNTPIKGHKVTELIKKKKNFVSAAYKKFTSDLKTQIESEGMEKDTSYKWKSKER